LPGLTPEKFREAIESGNTYDGVMKKTPTTTGETYYVPSGRLHGLDEGNLAFEFSRTPIPVSVGIGPVRRGRSHSCRDAQKHKDLRLSALSTKTGRKSKPLCDAARRRSRAHLLRGLPLLCVGALARQYSDHLQ
jgi:hypothetical protein